MLFLVSLVLISEKNKVEWPVNAYITSHGDECSHSRNTISGLYQLYPLARFFVKQPYNKNEMESLLCCILSTQGSHHLL